MGGCESKQPDKHVQEDAAHELADALSDHGEQLYSAVPAPPPDARLDGFHVCIVARFASGLDPQAGPTAVRLKFVNNQEDLTTAFVTPDSDGTVSAPGLRAMSCLLLLPRSSLLLL